VVKIFAFPRSKSGIFDLTLNPAVSGKHFSKVSIWEVILITTQVVRFMVEP
jgi:hypothetical protein